MIEHFVQGSAIMPTSQLQNRLNTKGVRWTVEWTCTISCQFKLIITLSNENKRIYKLYSTAQHITQNYSPETVLHVIYCPARPSTRRCLQRTLVT